MKKNINYILLAMGVIIFAACKKNAIQNINTTPVGAYFRAHNFAIGGPTVNIYADGIKITAIGSATGIEATTGIAANGIFPGTNGYLSLAQSSNTTFISKIPTLATLNPNTTTSTISSPISIDKYYSYFTCGIYDSANKTTDAFIIEDVLPSIDTGMAYVRIVNTVPNATSGFSLSAIETTNLAAVTIAGPTAYKGASAFVKVPNGVYNLTAVSLASPTNVTINRSAVSFTKGFIYTITTRGNFVTASTLGLDLTRNR